MNLFCPGNVCVQRIFLTQGILGWCVCKFIANANSTSKFWKRGMNSACRHLPIYVLEQTVLSTLCERRKPCWCLHPNSSYTCAKVFFLTDAIGRRQTTIRDGWRLERVYFRIWNKKQSKRASQMLPKKRLFLPLASYRKHPPQFLIREENHFLAFSVMPNLQLWKLCTRKERKKGRKKRERERKRGRDRENERKKGTT